MFTSSQVRIQDAHPALGSSLCGLPLAAAALALCRHEQDRGFVQSNPRAGELHRLSRELGAPFVVLPAENRAARPQSPRQCPLCRTAWTARRQRYFSVAGANDLWIALANPFPATAHALTLVAPKHRAAFGPRTVDSPVQLSRMIEDLVGVAEAMPGWTVFANGISSAASVPGHAHMQAVLLPQGHVFAAAAGATGTVLADGWHGGREGGEDRSDRWSYPIVRHFCRGRSRAVSRGTLAALLGWRPHRRRAATGNLVARAVGYGMLEVMFFPREAVEPDSSRSALGALECAGTFLLSGEMLTAFDRGALGAADLEQALRRRGEPMILTRT